MRRRKRQRPESAEAGKRKRDWSGIDAVPDIGDGPAGLVVVLVLIAVILLVVFGPTVLLLGIDLLWFVTVFTAGVFARFVLRKPWRVEAVCTHGGHHDEPVTGFRAAGRRRDELADGIAAGLVPVTE